MAEEPFEIDGLDGYQFEELIAKIMKKNGYLNIQVQPYSNDIGKDIIMESSDGSVTIVECKHQKFVGRPVIQKLQGAMIHQRTHNPNKEVLGMLVTSGAFSNEAVQYNKEIDQKIELIDGKTLNKLCRELNLVLVNGKVQIITNTSFRNTTATDSEAFSKKNYSHIRGSSALIPKISSKCVFEPVCHIAYAVDFDTCTSIGCIDSYSRNGKIAIDGVTGHPIDNKIEDFFFSGKIYTEEKHDAPHKIPFEFTENDVEEFAVNKIIRNHSHHASYTGNNNVTYTKECVPKRRDIDLKQFLAVYLPKWTNSIQIKKQTYLQEFYANEEKKLVVVDELTRCKICGKFEKEHENISVCPDCAKIVCRDHVKIDYLDKKSPICVDDAKALKIFFENKYFATNEHLTAYKQWLNSRNIIEKIFEDKFALAGTICGALFALYLIYRLLSH
ncbi:MAG: restriction endonuclease [Candidatus Micrarchaeia archaeon]|jgi:restriction system protein